MPFGYKSIWIQLAAEAAVLAWFVWRFSDRYLAGTFDGPDGTMALGRTMLWFVAAIVVGVIGLHVVGLIVVAIVRGGEEPDTTMDERDRAIELSGERVANKLAGGGFGIGLMILAAGGNVPVAIAAMFLAMIGGEIVGNLVKLRGYAEG